MNATPRRPPAARQRALTSRMVLNVSGVVHQRLTAIKAAQETGRGRAVTYSEVLEQLLEVWDEFEYRQLPGGEQ